MENTTLKPISLTTQTHQPLPKAKRSQAKPPRSAAALRSPGNEANRLEKILEQYGCGPVQFSGSGNASYERHLIFDNIITPGTAVPRERFEALARSVRDLLSQRWVRTEEHYTRKNPKRIYYL